MKLNQISFLAMALLSLQSSADILDLDYHLPLAIQSNFESISKVSDGPSNACSKQYEGMLVDGVLDIRYAFGYFDFSESGEDVTYRSHKDAPLMNYGIGPSWDPDFYYATIKFLTGRCEYPYQASCGFHLIGNPEDGEVSLQKYVNLYDQSILVRITLTMASAGYYLKENKTILKDRQDMLTRQSEANFFDSISTADVIFYNGHSRNGGGPDFHPPVLNYKNKPDYNGYYLVKKTGINRLLKEIKARKDNNYILGLFSCFSQKHFYNSLMKTRPGLRVALSAEEINYWDTYDASLGILEGILQGSCGQNLAERSLVTPTTKTGFKIFNF